MSKTVSIPLYMEAHVFETPDNNPIVFPEKCVYCCGPKEKTHNELKVDPPVGSVKKTLATRIPVPFCRKHSGFTGGTSLPCCGCPSCSAWPA